MKLSEFPQVRNLPIQEKLELVDEIWRDVAQELDAMDVSAEEKQILDSRWETFMEKPDASLTTEDFMKRLRALRA